MHEKSGWRYGAQMPSRRGGAIQDIECLLDARIGASGHYRAGLQRACAMQRRCRGWCHSLPAGMPTRCCHQPRMIFVMRHAVWFTGTVLPVVLVWRSIHRAAPDANTSCVSRGLRRGVKVTRRRGPRMGRHNQKSRADARLCSLPIGPLRGRYVLFQGQLRICQPIVAVAGLRPSGT